MARIMKTEYVKTLMANTDVCTYLHWLDSTFNKFKKRHLNLPLHQISEKLSTLKGATSRTWCILLEVRSVKGIVPASLHIISKGIVPVCGVRLFLVQEDFLYFISMWKKEHITTSITVRFQEVLYARFCCCCCCCCLLLLLSSFLFLFLFFFFFCMQVLAVWTQYAIILEANILLSADGGMFSVLIWWS